MSATGFQILRSSDGGAPALDGQAGSLINVLDALLDIGGSDAYWAKAFTGTNKAAYRAANGERFYLRVDDSVGQYARVRGYASMSDVDTGSGDFPTTTHQTNYNWHKSNTADSTARTYVGIATDRFVLLLVSGGWTGSGQDLYFFGEPKKFYASDTGSTVLHGYPGNTIGTSAFRQGGQSTNPYSISGSYNAPSNNTSGMMPFAKTADGAGAAGTGVYFAPSPSTSVPFGTYGYLPLIPLLCGSTVSGTAGLLRAALPHIYALPNYETDPNLAAGDTFTDDDGRTYQICTPAGTASLSSSAALFAIMTSNTETAVP